MPPGFSCMAGNLALPSSSELPRRLLGFLDEHFETWEDLSRVSSLTVQLRRDCGAVERDLFDLKKKLSSSIEAWASRSSEVGKILKNLNADLEMKICPSQDGKVEMCSMKILEVELPLLAREVGRIETVRDYAETVLQMEALVGDLEDASFCLMSENSMFSMNLSHATSQTDIIWKHEKLMLAVKAMRSIEELLVKIQTCGPKWVNLLEAVDSRVENTLAILRRQALKDHGAVLTSLGWPPPLSTSISEKDGCSEIPNPFLFMHGDKKEKYSQSFLALCALQHLQACREVRKNILVIHHKGHTSLESLELDISSDHGLWTIEELIFPIASRIEHHFIRWSDQPRFIFALVYKLTGDFVEGVENVLQPLIDKARLVGYSAKEAWVSAMVKMLSKYLEKNFFPDLVKRYGSENGTSEVVMAWLHLVDLIITFDKRMQGLAHSNVPFVGKLSVSDGISRPKSLLSVFCDHPDWLEIWAKMELKDAEDKLKSELADARAWVININHVTELIHENAIQTFLFSTHDDYKSPVIADSVVRIMWSIIERCQNLPSMPLRIQFIRSSATTFLHQFFIVLLQRCEEMDSMSTIVEDDVLISVVGAVNAAHYCESILAEWSEDVNFLEMSIAEDEGKGEIKDNLVHYGCFFNVEIECLIKFETDLIEKIMTALLIQFDCLCWQYVQNREQWEQEFSQIEADAISYEDNFTVSAELIEALDALRDRLRILEQFLNSKDFQDLWRSVAGGLDHFIFNSIVLTNINFSSWGANQFKADMGALFFVFRPFCARPEAFFPFVGDMLKLFATCFVELRQLQRVPSMDERGFQQWLHLHGVFHVSPAQVERLMNNVSF